MKQKHLKYQEKQDNLNLIKMAMKITVISIIFSLLEGLIMNKKYTKKEIIVFLTFNFMTNYIISCVK